MVLSETMTQVLGKVQTQPDGDGSKRSGEASRQARATPTSLVTFLQMRRLSGLVLNIVPLCSVPPSQGNSGMMDTQQDSPIMAVTPL